MSVPSFTDRRRFLVILSGGGVLAFSVLALLPWSPGQNQLGTWLAVAISSANLITALLLGRIRPVAHHILVVSSVVAVTIALCDSDAGRDSDLYLLWYAWIAAYGAMVHRLWVAVVHAALVSAGAVAGFAFEGDLGVAMPAVVMTVFTVTGTTLVVYGFGRWSQLLVDRDPLTGLANRAGLARVAQPAIAASIAAGRHAVLVLLDINRFREVNDALGHDAGDRLLQAIAMQLCSVPVDPAFTGRIGSDEFAVVMCGVELPDDPEAARDQMRTIGRTVISQILGPFRIDGVEVEVEASAGVAVAPLHGASLDALLPAADAALHAAKRDGERAGVWDPAMAGVRPWELALHAQLRAAVAGGELVLHYQPLQSAQTGRIAGVEALLRWAHPNRGLLAPGAFLPMAERSTLIIDVTEWVLNEALRQCADWASAGHHVPVSVNLSARMLVREDLPDLVSATLSVHGLPADVLTLEITESALVTQPARAAAMLRELRTRGVKLSLDDFGTGYSSMEILKALPFDEVKIDRGFVSDAHGSLPDIAIVRTVLELGHRLGLRVVGEGVEDARALRMLMELGCDLLQGEAISRPLPPSPELLALLTAQACAVVSAVPGPVATVEPDPAAGPDRVARPFPPELLMAGPAVVRPADEPARIAALRRYEILDSDSEPEFDEIAALAARLCDTPVGFVAFLDTDREWFKACHGSTVTEQPRDVSVSQWALAETGVFEIPDTAADPRFMRLAGIGPRRSFRFYAGAPITTPDRKVIGHVVAVDRIPHALTPGQRESLAALGHQVMHVLEARRANRMLAEVTRALGVLDQFWYPDHLESAGSMVAEVSRALLDADAASLLLADLPGSTVFHVVATVTKSGGDGATKSGGDAATPAQRFTGRDTVGIGAVLRTRAPVFLADVASSTLFPADVVRRLGIASALLVPLPGEGGLIGLVVARWMVGRDEADQAGLRAVTLLGGQAGHTLARLRRAQVHVREIGIDPATSLTSRERFLAILQGLPARTVLCLFAVLGAPSDACSGTCSGTGCICGDEHILKQFAGQLRAAAGPGAELARWSHNRFVVAFPAGSHTGSDEMIARLRVTWDGEPRPSFVVGTAVTEVDQPPSAALGDAENALRAAQRAVGRTLVSRVNGGTRGIAAGDRAGVRA